MRISEVLISWMLMPSRASVENMRDATPGWLRVPTPVDGYRWATANDADERDPVGWRVDGSHDGVNWITLDEHSNYPTPTARNAYLSDFALGAHPPFGISQISVTPTP